jgi:CDP-diacylglycerol---serine O-phosphatidyltransferase
VDIEHPAKDIDPEKRKFRLARGARTRRLHEKVFLIPSLVTAGAFFCGFLATISIFRGHYEYAVGCIALSFILDGLDGRVARRLNATSPFGRELDSLSDVVAFGVAPALLVYSWGLSRLADEFGVLVAFLFAVCGGARLARFNVNTSDEPKKHFQGLPIPAAAAALCSLVYFHPVPLDNTFAVAFCVALTLLLAVLMVSSIPYASVKHLKFTSKHARRDMLIFGLAVALLWYHSRLLIFIGLLGYVASGPVLMLINKRRAVEAPPKSEAV